MTRGTGLPIKPPRVHVDRRADGSVVLENRWPVPRVAHSILHRFDERARMHPGRDFVAKRVPVPGGGWGDWRRLSYGDASTQVRALAQAMLDRGLGQGAAVMILSGPSLEHAVVALAAQWAHAPVAAVAVAYSTLAEDFTKLNHVFGLVKPKLVFVDGGAAYAPALRSLPLDGVEVWAVEPVPGVETTLLGEMLKTGPGPDVDAALATLRPETVARYIFTSGSTGRPKGAIHTQGTMMAQVASRNALLANAAEEEEAIRLSWMPWNHSGGVIHMNFNIEDGGTFYIDEGRPMPGLFGETLRNLRDVVPAEFSSAPILYGHLAKALEEDAALRRRFFTQVRYLTYASAALSDDVFQRIQAMALAETGAPVAFCTKYGTTEVQSVTHTARPLTRTGDIGVPYPGASIKLAPVGDKLEIRVKGAMVAPGYLGGEDVNRGVFDEEGFYRTGDAAAFVDLDNPELGLMFDGRVTENFKLSTGTWVSVGQLRLALIEALSPLLQDAVIAGHDKDFIAVLAWPQAEEAARLAGAPPGLPLAETVAAPAVRAFVQERLMRHNAAAAGSSLKVRRLTLLTEPPKGDEIAEKGYVNQRAVLDRRAAQAKALYEDQPPATVISAEPPPFSA